MDRYRGFGSPVFYPVLAALLFGLGIPLAKILLPSVSPWLMAALLYLGSGLGLKAFRFLSRAPQVTLQRNEWLWLVLAIGAGGVIAPVLLMVGLSSMPASGASLLLNVEGVLTAGLAWFVFKENFDKRIALGMVAIVIGTIVLSWPGPSGFAGIWPSLAIIGACLGWALDNNLTRKISWNDATWIAATKGLVAGVVNLGIALGLGSVWPSSSLVLQTMFLGAISYGVSLALFVISLRHLGTARTGAYFSLAPFFGALVSIPLLNESLSARFLGAGALMGFGVWLHLTEKHSHEHTHEELDHEHDHSHDDEHHDHEHYPAVPLGTKHSHRHHHVRRTHTHEHFPDMHHQHDH
ncbi:MAG: DMT family transporter [Proteobacteria bacterium]|nr:MAG: DMT family transporter [Pseudomonadota bacterium]